MVVHPDRVVAQFEGAAVMGLGNTLYSSVTFKQGSRSRAISAITR